MFLFNVYKVCVFFDIRLEPPLWGQWRLPGWPRLFLTLLLINTKHYLSISIIYDVPTTFYGHHHADKSRQVALGRPND